MYALACFFKNDLKMFKLLLSFLKMCPIHLTGILMEVICLCV